MSDNKWQPWQRDTASFIEAVKERTALSDKELADKLKIADDYLRRRRQGRAAPELHLVRQLVTFCQAEGLNKAIPPTIMSVIRDPSDRETARLGLDIKAAVGLTNDGTARSIKAYRGSYWHVYWAEDGRLAVLRSFLHKTPRNGVPIFRSWRRHCLGFKVQIGSYFLEGEHLSLVGTRHDDINVRLSVFHCNPWEDENHILCGLTSGVDGDNNLFSSPAVLFRAQSNQNSGKFDVAHTGLHEPSVVSNWFGLAIDHVLKTPQLRMEARN